MRAARLALNSPRPLGLALLVATICCGSVAAVATTTTCLGTYGYAYHFRWASYIEVAECGFVPQTAFTYSLWLKPYTVAEDLGVIGTLYASSITEYHNSGLRVSGAEIALMLALPGNPGALTKVVRAPIQPSAWTHVAATFNAGENGGTARLYVNGALVANASQLGSINATDSGCTLRIARDGIDDMLFTGQMDEIQVWSRALPASEVALRYRSQLLGVEPGLVLYLVADGDNHTHAIDHSQGAHHAKAVSGDRYKGLGFFSYVPDCVGCFGAAWPRCAPWQSANDRCGDGLITGAEGCELGDVNCTSNCTCPAGYVPSVSAHGCVPADSTCKTANIDVCAGAAMCGTSCECILEEGLGCLTSFSCSLYDMPVIGTMAWTVCFAACAPNINAVCFGSVPEKCLKYRMVSECATPAAAAEGCSWCIDHCADSKAECMEQCGNGVIEAINAESCDDGNFVNGDGCDAGCAIEAGWICSIGVCMPICGDGKLIGAEQCDDGNGDSNDGCNATCSIEAGWTCNTSSVPTRCTRPKTWTGGHTAAVVVGSVAVVLGIAGAAAAVVYLRYFKKPPQKGENKPIEHNVTAVILDGMPAPMPVAAIVLDPLPNPGATSPDSFPAVPVAGVLQDVQAQQILDQQQAMYSSPFPAQQLQPQSVASFAGWGDQDSLQQPPALNPPGMHLEM